MHEHIRGREVTAVLQHQSTNLCKGAQQRAVARRQPFAILTTNQILICAPGAAEAAEEAALAAEAAEDAAPLQLPE